MNSNQINLFITPTDLSACERRILEKGPVVFFEYRSETSKPQVIDSSKITEMGKEWLSIGLARLKDIDLVKFKPVVGQPYFTLDILTSPVIELNRCYFDGNKLRRGRLYYTTSSYNEFGVLIKKDMEFLDWAKDILMTTKRGLRFDSKLQSYLGSDAEEAFKAGKCHFVQ